MDAMEESRQRAIRITTSIMRRVDLGVLADIRSFDCPREHYESDLKTLGIHADAWKHVIKQKIEPKFVFAHPCILSKLPKSSLHYRGISTLSLKRVSSITVSVKKWENGTNKQTPDHLTCVRVACLYNAIISTIITNSDNWSIENGYRNILATIGITEDGKLRNIIGIEGENYVKQSILNWLKTEKQIPFEIVKKDTHYLLGDEKNIRMVFSSEPDILFEKKTGDTWHIVATIEIKSGTDPAGALERLGALQKSFANTPARSKNFAVLGVITPKMVKRLNEMHVEKYFSLWEVMAEDKWNGFVKEIFHHTLRLIR